MSTNGPNSTPTGGTEELSAALGVEITEEGKARARQKLDRAAAARTPERTNALRAKLGMPPLPAAS